MTEGQALVEEVRFGGQQVVEGERRVTGDPHADHPHPEARHRLVVTVGVPVVGGKSPDRPGDGIGGSGHTEPADLDPGQPKVIAMMEVLIGDLPRLERGEEQFVGGRDARLSL